MTFANASLLAEDAIARYLIENSPRKLQIARVWPHLGISGKEIQYPRTGYLGAAAVDDTCGPVTDADDDVISPQASFELLEFITRYQICFSDLDRFRYPNDLDTVRYALALRRLIYGYYSHLDGGSGLRSAIPNTQQVTMSGGALTLDCLDHAYNLVTANDGRPNVIMASSRGLRTYSKLCRDKGYDTPMMPFEWYDPALGRMASSLVPHFNGTPWLINGLMESESTDTASAQRIYFMVLGDDGQAGPTRGVTGIVPEDLKGSMFIKRVTHGVPQSEVENVNVPEAPTTIQVQPPISVKPISDVWVTWPVGFAVGSESALSMIENFAPVANCALVTP